MKKKMVTLLTVVMVAALTACGSGTPDDQGSSGPAQGSTQESTQDSTQDDGSTNVSDSAQESTQDGTQEDESTGASDSTQDQQGSAEGTNGQILLEDFLARVEAGEDENLETLAEGLLSNSVCNFMSGYVPVQEGLLQGFDNFEVKGFEEGVQFGPMMGSIPFIGYLFHLKEGTDADAFVQDLKDNSNQRWQICVAADETVAEVSGNTVFFVMCKNAQE